jgi:hypothetical protein
MNYGTIQFHHNKADGITYALDVNFNREDLLETVHNFDEPITLMLGQSFVHPNDIYCKKTGREVSMTKLEPVKFKLERVLNNQEKVWLTFVNEDYSIEFRVNKHSEKPHFLNIEEHIF